MKKYVYAFLIWVMIIPIAILNGGFREYVLAYLGGLARPLSGIILSIWIYRFVYNRILLYQGIILIYLIIYTLSNDVIFEKMLDCKPCL